MLLKFPCAKNNSAGKEDSMQHKKSANTNIQISDACDLNYTFFWILNSQVISNSTFCIIFWNKVLVPESQSIEVSRKHCHTLM